MSVGEARHESQASDRLACLQENSLVAEAMLLRAADRNASSAANDLYESYEEQAAYWRKKIAKAEGKSFEEDAFTDDKILKSNRLIFFNIYKRALNGDLDAMKACLEFCEEEASYWHNRYMLL